MHLQGEETIAKTPKTSQYLLHRMALYTLWTRGISGIKHE